MAGDGDEELRELALEGLKVLRSSPAYAVARSLELWRQQEEERARTRLQEKEGGSAKSSAKFLSGELRERLDEEYRQRELVRAQTFRQQQTELRELEHRAKKKLQDRLQIRPPTKLEDVLRISRVGGSLMMAQASIRVCSGMPSWMRDNGAAPRQTYTHP